jgi:DNA-binding CsgD family transcriptional regulator
MSLSSKKPDSVENDPDSLYRGRLPVRILDDNQWLFIRKSFRMSPRELIVAKFVCGGLSNEEIATRLGIKTATIKTHLRNIYRRIRVQRKLDMLLMFLEQSDKYSSTRSDVSINAVDAPTVREIGNKGNFAGR